MRRSLASVALLAVVAFASRADADAPTRVLVVSDAENDPLAARLAVELRALGLEVEEARPTAGDSLETIAREHHADALARVGHAPASVSMWIDPTRFPQPGAPPVLHVDAGGANGSDSGLLALRAVELLRGRLLQVAAPIAARVEPPIGPPPIASPLASAPPAPGVPDDRRASQLRSPSRFAVAIGPALLATPGGLAPLPGAFLGADARVGDRLHAGLALLPPIATSAARGAQGGASVRLGLAAASASARFDLGRAFFDAGAGAGVVLALFSGDATPPAIASSGAAALFFPFARAGGGASLGDRLALRADLLFGATLPRAAIRVAGEEVASLGRPLALGVVALEVTP